jgi:hypothetical protein
MCHDHSLIYFRSQEACETHNTYVDPEMGLQHINCRDLTLGGINDIEIISTERGQVLRFFQVQLEYLQTEVEFISYDNNGEAPLYVELSRQSRLTQVQPCSPESNALSGPLNRVLEREAAENEVAFINQLIEADIRILNQPFGPLTNLNFINPAMNAFSIDESYINARTRSPQCQESGDGSILFRKASGENSGDGIFQWFSTSVSLESLQEMELAPLQENSRELHNDFNFIIDQEPFFQCSGQEMEL